MTNSPPTNLTRLPVVDALRGVAIGMVFVFHYFGFRHGWDMYRWDGPWRDGHVLGWPADPLVFPITWGWAGVSLFFVLSGFVIHLQAASRPTFSAAPFLRRRLWRIAPAYYAAVAALGLLYWVTPFEWSGQRQYLTHVLFIHNWFPATFFGINGPFWSLASEVQFYLAYPLVVWARGRVGMGRVLAAAAALSVVSRVVFLLVADCPYPITPLWTAFPVLWVDWLLGAWVAERFRLGQLAFPGRAWPAAAAAAFFLAGLWKPANCLSFSLASLTWAVVLDRVIRRDWRPGRVGRAACHLGLISYSMYLWHDPLIEVIGHWLDRRRGLFPEADAVTGAAFFVITWAAVYVVAAVSYRWLEDPRWLWRRRPPT